MSELKRTPIFPEYKELGGKTIDFGGWDLPVQYSSIKQEHLATRTEAGLFDVSHMGEIVVKGPKSLEYLQKLTTNDVAKLVDNQVHYTFMCYENGGTVDDFLIYRMAEDRFLLVVNASNVEKDFEWLQKNNNYSAEDVIIENVSDDSAILAIQGPKAQEILQTVTETDLSQIKFFRFNAAVEFNSIKDSAIVSRTGYTGEDGFEIYIDKDSARDLWNLILKAGKDNGLVPAGLGARDTLRFEVGLPLYGQELTPEVSPVEADLLFAVKVNKDSDFIGKDVLKAQVENGRDRISVGIEMIDKGIPRTGYTILAGDEEVGFVTSGTQSPTLEKNIGRVLVKSEYAEVGTELNVQVRKRTLKAVVVKTPFYKPGK